MKDSCNDARLK